MTNLTEKWKKGELANGTYYVRLNHDSSTIDVYDCGVWWSDAWQEITGVLAPVPSFKEYQKLLSDQLAKNEGVEINAEIEAENTKLKGLLKECKALLSCLQIDDYDKNGLLILSKINQVLGEKQ